MRFRKQVRETLAKSCLCFFSTATCNTRIYPRVEASDISDTNRICECSGSTPRGRRTENDRRTFNGCATLEAGIDVTLDYLNGPDPNTMVSLFLMFYSHE